MNSKLKTFISVNCESDNLKRIIIKDHFTIDNLMIYMKNKSIITINTFRYSNECKITINNSTIISYFDGFFFGFDGIYLEHLDELNSFNNSLIYFKDIIKINGIIRITTTSNKTPNKVYIISDKLTNLESLQETINKIINQSKIGE